MMSSTPHVRMIFATNLETMIATKKLRDAGFSPRLISKPSEVESEADFCLCVTRAIEHAARATLAAAHLTPTIA